MKIYTDQGTFFYTFEYDEDEEGRTITTFISGQIFYDQSAGGTKTEERFQIRAQGFAKCSKKDKFDKSFGRYLAFRRALKKEKDRAFRKVIGDHVRKEVKIVQKEFSRNMLNRKLDPEEPFLDPKPLV
jgi:hypothetical protein